MTEYVFRDAPGYGCDMSALMDGGRVTVGEYFASDATDHYGTLHEEIVRCRDCKYARPEPPSDRRSRKKYQGGYWCDYWSEGIGAWCEPDGFCSVGERKEGGDD